MTTYVALLRGINVGGHNRVAMADLRALLGDLGHGDVRTYLQSGNAIFTSDRSEPDALADEIRSGLENTLDVTSTVMIRSLDEIIAIAAANPYPDQAAADPKKVHAAFLSTAPEDPSVIDLHADEYAPEECTAGERVVYLHLPDGIGRSRLASDLGKRLSGAEMTVRNWRTVERIIELANDVGSASD